MKTDFDILIIGGGLVGASLACALRESPLRIGIIEAMPMATPAQANDDVQENTTADAQGRMPGTADDRVLALAYGSKQIFDSMDCWRDIAPQATPIERIHVSDRGHFGVTRLSASESCLPALGYVVAHRVLGTSLAKTLHGIENIEWLCPAEMRDIRIDSESASVTLKHAGKDRALTARLVIAADGAHSAARAALGINAERIEYCQSAIVTTVMTSEPHANTAYERFTDSGPLALLPLPNNRCAVVWSAKVESVDAILGWRDQEFLTRLQDRFGDRLGLFTQLGRRSAYPLALTRVKEHVRSRLALIGNAAHTVHPVAGQGFNLGLRDVAAIAEILTDALRRGEDISELSVLHRYADWRARDNRMTAAFTNGLIRIFSNNAFPLTLARNAGLLAVDLLPGVKHDLVRVTSGLAGRLPRLARGLPL